MLCWLVVDVPNPRVYKYARIRMITNVCLCQSSVDYWNTKTLHTWLKKTLGGAVLWLLAFPGESSPIFPCIALGQESYLIPQSNLICFYTRYDAGFSCCCFLSRRKLQTQINFLTMLESTFRKQSDIHHVRLRSGLVPKRCCVNRERKLQYSLRHSLSIPQFKVNLQLVIHQPRVWLCVCVCVWGEGRGRRGQIEYSGLLPLNQVPSK